MAWKVPLDCEWLSRPPDMRFELKRMNNKVNKLNLLKVQTNINITVVNISNKQSWKTFQE